MLSCSLIFKTIAREYRKMDKNKDFMENSENKFRALYESSDDAILLLETDVIVDSNKAAVNLLSSNRSKEDLIGSKLFDLSQTKTSLSKKQFRLFAREFRDKGHVTFDWKLNGIHGEIDAKISFKKTEIEGGDFYQCIIRDNTIQNKNLRQSAANLQNLQNVLDSNPQGIAIVKDGIVLYRNSAFAQLFGTSEKFEIDVKSKSKHKLDSIIDKAAIATSREKIYANSIDGKRLVLDTIGVSTRFKNQDALLLIFNDVTAEKELEKEQLRAELAEELNKKLERQINERIRAEKKLQEEFLRSRAILDSSANTYLLTTNLQLEITSFNSHFKNVVFNHSRKSLSFGESIENLMDLFIDQEKGKLIKRIFQLTKRGKSYHDTLEFSLNGDIVWWDIYLNPIFNITGRVIEISIVAHDVTEKKLAELEILESLKEKEILLKEIHHRVKNNLQVISSILNLQSSFVEDNQTQDILMESRNRVRTMAIIHENLYRTEDFSSIDFGEYLSNLARNLIASYRVNVKVDLELKVNSVKLNIDQAIPCGLLVNEVVSNALKYAWNENQEGKLLVKLELDNSNVVNLEITDNGKGLPDEFENLNSDTLGLQLISTLVEQLDGELNVERVKGTKYFIKFERI